MKRGTPRHPKVFDLAVRLSITPYAAVGLLEMLWHFAAEFCHAGDVGRFQDEAIAKALYWDGTSTKLVSCLIESGWLDECSCHRLRVHDWPDHADQTVERVLEKRKLSFLACYEHTSLKLGSNCKKTSQPSPSPSPSPCTRVRVTVPVTEHHAFIAAWAEAFHASHGSKYVFKGGRDGKAVKALLTSEPSAEALMKIVVAAWTRGRDCPKDWACKNKTSTIYDFYEYINQIQSELKNGSKTRVLNPAADRLNAGTCATTTDFVAAAKLRAAKMGRQVAPPANQPPSTG
jgi:hypothetical protein